MANRLFQTLFQTMVRGYVHLAGKISLVTAVKATKVTQGLTLTAVDFGIGGNDITIAFTGGATAGAEVVSVSGKAISVQIESGVSTVTQVRTALQAAGAATALAVTTGTSGSAVATAAAVSLTGGVDGVSTQAINGVASVARTGVGEYTVTLADQYSALESCNLTLKAATAVDLVPQIKSHDVAGAKTIVFRLLAGATATEVAAACEVHFSAVLRNSSLLK